MNRYSSKKSDIYRVYEGRGIYSEPSHENVLITDSFLLILDTWPFKPCLR